ncbi:MAG: class I mannose-6-phosphate isomerase, partial [Lachnospiraceae bacterium]|nr:class I mannose-6-phosphate isomerase [Lachnospiraceae bacterium]
RLSRVRKTECWYVMDCPEDAELVIGHNAKTREELRSMILEERYEELIRRVPVKKGDFIQIVAGTIHAITEGMLILETQQNCDITYRVYDYGRITDGKMRPLHVMQSIEAANVPDYTDERGILHAANVPENQPVELVACEYYKVWKLCVKAIFEMQQNQPFLLVSVLDGEGVIEGHPLKKGDHLILPSGYGRVVFEGNLEMILSAPVKQGEKNGGPGTF